MVLIAAYSILARPPPDAVMITAVPALLL